MKKDSPFGFLSRKADFYVNFGKNREKRKVFLYFFSGLWYIIQYVYVTMRPEREPPEAVLCR